MNYALSQTIALWVIASLWLISVICVFIGIMYLVRFLQEAMVVFRRIERVTEDLRTQLYPVLEDSRKTLDEVRKTTLKINDLSVKADKILSSVSSAAAAARFITGLVPVKGRGLWNGLLSGLNMFKIFSNGGKNKNE
ncbi:MAG: hypothetical protein IK083_08095 [Abditibacteriota bacterium]|nr:hypothetical protein [Abditibacteriota bacterium]